jgi:hypothetical protein
MINQFLKKISWFLSAATMLLVFSAPAAVSAQVHTGQLCSGADLSLGGGGSCKVDNGSGGTEDAADKANSIVADVINFVSIVVGVIAVFMVIYGGFRFLTSAGNPESTKVGKNAILYALIGLVIVAFAQIIVKFVLNKITT